MPGGHSWVGTRSAPVFARAIDPATLPHLEWYLRADTLTGVNGSPVTTWPDSSGHSPARDAAGGGTVLPTLQVGASPNGLNMVQYHTSAQSNHTGSFGNTPGITNVRGYTFYLYYRQQDLTLGQIFLNIPTGTGLQITNVNAAAFGNGQPDGVIVIHNGGFASAGAMTAGVHVTSIVFPPPTITGIGRTYQDGVLKLSHTWAWNDIEGPYNVGINGNFANPFHGQFGALIMYSDNHSDATRRGVETYLRRHYG